MQRRITIIALALILAVFVLACEGDTLHRQPTESDLQRMGVTVEECINTNGGRACHKVRIPYDQCVAQYGADFCNHN